MWVCTQTAIIFLEAQLVFLFHVFHFCLLLKLLKKQENKKKKKKVLNKSETTLNVSLRRVDAFNTASGLQLPCQVDVWSPSTSDWAGSRIYYTDFFKMMHHTQFQKLFCFVHMTTDLNLFRLECFQNELLKCEKHSRVQLTQSLYKQTLLTVKVLIQLVSSSTVTEFRLWHGLRGSE